MFKWTVDINHKILKSEESGKSLKLVTQSLSLVILNTYIDCNYPITGYNHVSVDEHDEAPVHL